MSIIQLPEEITKELRINSRGETTCTIRGLGRMFLVDHKGLCSHISGDLKTSLLHKTLLEQGFEVVSWAENGVPDVAIPTIAQYYAFDAKQVSDETKNAARNFIRVTSAIGVRTFFQHKLGFEPGDTRDALMSQLSLMITEAVNPILEQVKQQNAMLEASTEERQQLQNENAELNEYKEDVETYPEFAYLLDVAKGEIETHEYVEGISCKEYITRHNIPLDENAWCTLSRRTASYYRSTKGSSPKRRGSQNIYYNKDVAYIVATLRLIMKGL